MWINFVKMHGAGNDFVLIDNRTGIFRGDETVLIQNICNRRFGIGSDGLILIEAGERTHFRMRFFNPDGSPADMCGNGSRCAIYFAHQLGLVPRQGITFEIAGKTYQGQFISDRVIRLTMQPYRHLTPTIALTEVIQDDFHDGIWVEAGVPHLVLLTDRDLTYRDIMNIAPRYRYHPAFRPMGTNVNFLRLDQGGIFKVRTYERGVEDETLSCGTGAVACGVFAREKLGWTSPVVVEYPGGTLTVDWEPNSDTLYLTGPVTPVFEGRFQREVFELPEPGLA